MRKVSTYLFRSAQSRRYYFRRMIPKALRSHFKRSEIKVSLKTTDKSQALFLAGKLALESSNIFAKLNSLSLHYIIRTNDIEITLKSLETLPHIKQPTKIFSDNLSYLPSNNIQTLSSIYKEYHHAKTNDNSWSPATEKINNESFELLLFILGDNAIESITRNDARYVQDCLKSYPKNKNKKKKYVNLTMQDLLGTPPEECISIRTINKHLQNYTQLFKWAIRENIVTFHNNPFEKLSIHDPTPAHLKVLPFTKEDLCKIFSGPIYEEHNFTHPYQFWACLIAIFSGSRRNQIASLEVSDIYKVDSIWVFDFNTNDKNKSVKTEASIRQVPIHSTLIEIGFLNYVAQMQAKGESRIFPELIKWNTFQGYGRPIGEWFNGNGEKYIGYKYKRKISAPDKKKFHSFRGTLADALYESGVNETDIKAIIGWKDTKNDTLKKIYLSPKDLNKLYNELNKVNLNSELLKIKKWKHR